MALARLATSQALRGIALTAAYVAAGWLGLLVAFVHGSVSPVWPPTGLAIAALTLWGPGLWPAVAAGSLAVNFLFAGNPLPAAAAIAVGSTLEAVLGALALRRFGIGGEISRLRDAVAIVGVALLAPLPSATGGVVSLTLSGFSAWADFPWVWLVWWLGDATGALLILPLVLAWGGRRSPLVQPARPAEFAGALGLSAALANVPYMYVGILAKIDVPVLPPDAFLIPPIVWAVLRLRPRETTLVVAATYAAAMAYAVAYSDGDIVGTLMWLQLVLLNVVGTSLLLVGAIAERGMVQQALRANEIRFRTIFEQAAVGIARVSRSDGRLLEVNQRLCGMLGYDRDELLGKTFEEITDPGALDEERKLVLDLFALRRACYVIEKRYLGKDGVPIWVRETSSLPADAQSAYRISIVEDIDKQQAAMAALQQTHAHLQFALQGANAGLWEWDLVRDQRHWAEDYAQSIGSACETPPSFEAWLSTIVPEDREWACQTLQSHYARKDGAFKLEFRVRHPQQGSRWLMAIGHITYTEDGAPARLVGLNVDVTDLKRAEETARAASRAKTTFLAAASHDLRQPVQALVLLNAALSAGLKDHPAATLVDKVGASLDALQRLLGALLDISRLDAGVVVPEIQAVPLGDVVERLSREYAVRAAERGLALRSVRPNAWTRTDPVLLERILRNLIENALRYTDRGKVLIGCRRRGDTIRLHVADTGIGIRREHQEAIFHEFYQVGNCERDREKGLGLGLSIVNRLCGLLGHRVSVASEPGRGTCFVIELPLVPAGGAPMAAAMPTGRLAVLVVDDDAMVRQALALLLEQWGCEVLVAEDAGDAVGRVGAIGRCPNAILADYRLPGGRTGIDAAMDVRRTCGREIPTIILTGDTAPDRIAEAKASGFRLMHKPVDPASLRAELGAMAADDARISA